MKTLINDTAIVTAAALLNASGNWLNVQIENAETPYKYTETTFCATGIEIYQESFPVFVRQFARPVMMLDGITEISIGTENAVSFTTERGEIWTVTAAHKDGLADCDNASGKADDLRTLIDWTRSQTDKAGNVRIVLDLRKLGYLTSKQERQIERFMNVQLDGLANPRQHCRTVYIRADNNADRTVYIGLYDLEAEKVMTGGLFDAVYLESIYDAEDKAKRDHIRQLVDYYREITAI